MASANIKINAVAASNDDLPINVLVSLDNQNTGGELTYLWAILDQPPGPADVLSSTVIQNPTFVPKKEGTYLLELIVNSTLPSEVRDRKIAAVRQVKTRERVPAADETTEDGTRGWAGAAGSFLQKVDAATSDPVIVVGQTGVAGLTVGNVVRCTGVATIKAGLPGQESVPSFTSANATVVTNVDEPLGILIGAVDGSGGPYAINTLVRVRIIGLFRGAAGIGAVVGNPVYLSDLGTLALAPGTVTRSLGTVAATTGVTFDCWFNGGTNADIILATTAPANVTKAAAAVGVSLTAARSDHKHDISTAVPAGTVATDGANAEGAATTLARSDHSHKASVANQNVNSNTGATITSVAPTFTEVGALNSFRLILAAGTYLVTCMVRCPNDTLGQANQIRLQKAASGGGFAGSTAIANTTVDGRVTVASGALTLNTHAIVVAAANDELYVGGAVTGGTMTALDRQLTALRLV